MVFWCDANSQSVQVLINMKKAVINQIGHKTFHERHDSRGIYLLIMFNVRGKALSLRVYERAVAPSDS